MKKILLLLTGAAVLSGCQAGTANTVTEPEPLEVPQVQAPKEPGTVEPTMIALLKGDEMLTVGAGSDRAFRIFRGDKPGGFMSDRLPPGFAEPYTARVWQGAKEGFGVISYAGAVVAAIHQRSGMTQDQVNDQVIPAYMNHFGIAREPQLVTGDRATYWFWSEPVMRDGLTVGEQVLMIMAFQTLRDGVFVTEAMGDADVLDALGISIAKARTDMIAADQILSRQEASENAGANR